MKNKMAGIKRLVILLPLLLGVGCAVLALVALQAPAVYAHPGAVIAVDTFDDEINSDGDCSLREAIQAANKDKPVSGCPAGNGHDTIQLEAGVYALSIAGSDEDNNQTGDLDIMNDPLTIVGSPAGQTSIHGSHIDRVLHIHGVDVQIERLWIAYGATPASVDGGDGGGIHSTGNLTITHGYVYSNTTGVQSHGADGGYGGGIYQGAGKLVLDQTHVWYNRTGKGAFGGHGGGIYAQGEIYLVASYVVGNRAGSGRNNSNGGSGGGIYAQNAATIESTLIVNNRAGNSKAGSATGDGGAGGGIAAFSDLTINPHCQIGNNRSGNALADNGNAGPGGGVYSVGGDLLVEYANIYGNHSGSANNGDGGDGGGIYREGKLTIHQSDIYDNHTGSGLDDSDPAGGDGGGIGGYGDWSISSSSVVSNSTSTGGAGGGIYAGTKAAGNERLQLTNSTISSNASGLYGGGISLSVNNDAYALTVQLSTIAENSAAQGGYGIHAFIYLETLTLDLSNSILSNSGPDYGESGSGITLNLTRSYTLLSDASLPLAGAGNLNNADPHLGALRDNGGWTYSHMPGHSSPAIDAGDPSFTPPPSFDQRESPYPRCINGRVDMGAIEYWPQVFLPLVAR